MGKILRELSMTHIPSDDPSDSYDELDGQRPDNRWISDTNDLNTAPPYSDELIDMLEQFEWDEMHTLYGYQNIRANSRWVVDTLFPAAQARVAAYRNFGDEEHAAYYDAMDVSWTKPRDTYTPFRYNPTYAGDAGDIAPPGSMGDDSNVPQDIRQAERSRMSVLGAYKNMWKEVQPYQVRRIDVGNNSEEGVETGRSQSYTVLLSIHVDENV